MKGICHTDIEYDSAGLKPLISHIEDYFKGNRLVPVSRTRNHTNGKYLYFTFSNDLLVQIIQTPKAMKKPYEAAVKYGFQGYSIGGRNGIFYQRKEDINLLTATEKLSHAHESELRNFMQYFGDLKNLRKIKIVTHNPTGHRIVGLYEERGAKAVFLDIAHY